MSGTSRRVVLSTMTGLAAALSLGEFASAETKKTRALKYRGVVYDVGLKYTPGPSSIEPFNPGLVEYDMGVIAKTLYANAVRIEGEEIERLVTASRAAHANGLSIFFNPWKMNADLEQTKTYYAQAAAEAEKLRAEGMDIILVLGCEYTIFSKGVFPGETFAERTGWFGPHVMKLGNMPHTPDRMPEEIRETSGKLNAALRAFVEVARASFKGPITYSAGTWEEVDWSIFDIVGIDYYRRGGTDADYVSNLDYYRHNKPVAVMEVGCCAYKGAAALGDGGFTVMEGSNPDGSGKWKGGVVPERSEKEQADYIEQQVNLLTEAGVDAVFIFNFAFPSTPVGEGAFDLDRATFGIVKTFGPKDPRSQKMPPWAPKEAFHRLAAVYRRQAESIKTVMR